MVEHADDLFGDRHLDAVLLAEGEDRLAALVGLAGLLRDRDGLLDAATRRLEGPLPRNAETGQSPAP